MVRITTSVTTSEHSSVTPQPSPTSTTLEESTIRVSTSVTPSDAPSHLSNDSSTSSASFATTITIRTSQNTIYKNESYPDTLKVTERQELALSDVFNVTEPLNVTELHVTEPLNVTEPHELAFNDTFNGTEALNIAEHQELHFSDPFNVTETFNVTEALNVAEDQEIHVDDPFNVTEQLQELGINEVDSIASNLTLSTEHLFVTPNETEPDFVNGPSSFESALETNSTSFDQEAIEHEIHVPEQLESMEKPKRMIPAASHHLTTQDGFSEVLPTPALTPEDVTTPIPNIDERLPAPASLNEDEWFKIHHSRSLHRY